MNKIYKKTWSKYPFNIHFFDEINTEEKAYILGFLYADGYNMEERNTVAISLKKEDSYILERIITN